MRGLLIAEKPSVMREVQALYNKEASSLPFTLDFAAFHGHLMELKAPEDYNPDWSDWNTLPIIPDEFAYKVKDAKSVQALASKIKAGNYDFLVNACDAGREGEHIFFSFYETLGLTLPVKRFWATSVAKPALKKALHGIQDSAKYDGLRQSSKYRAQLDWLVGMNFTRAATVKHGELTSIGRVQTPTLKLIVDRENQIRNFVPEDFYELKGTFKVNGVDLETVHLIAPDLKDTHFSNKADAEAIGADVKNKAPGSVLGTKNEVKTTAPPTLYSLTELQKAANRFLKFKPDKTLEIAQKLYEAGLLTYPRTESRFLPTDMIPEIADHIAPLNAVPELASYAAGIGQAEIDAMLKGKYVDDAGITDHHAIIPTDQTPNWASLSKDEQDLYALVGKSFLAIFMPPHKAGVSSIIIDVGGHMFRVRGNVEIDPGYTILYPKKKTKAAPLPACKKGDRADLVKTKITKGTTKAPDRYTPDTILSAMLHAGQALSDNEMRSILRESEGLGTPATRASILAKLETRGYVRLEKNYYYALDKGMHLIEVVGDRTFSSAALTAEWEKKLLGIEQGKYQGDFRKEMEQYTRDETSYLLSSLKSTVGQVVGTCPLCGGNVIDRGKLYVCEHRVKDDETSCRNYIPKTLAGYELTPDDINTILAGNKTDLRHFRNPKTKKEWDASLVLDKEKGLIFSFPEERPAVGTCPFCGGTVRDYGKFCACENRKKDDPSSCTMSFFKEISGCTLTQKDIETILSGGKTDLRRFSNPKTKKKWEASLILEKGKGLVFVFPEERPAVGVCPFCGGAVRDYGKVCACENRRKDDPSSCSVIFQKEIAGHALTKSDLKELFAGKPTKQHHFKNPKTGKEWNAMLVLEKEKGLVFSFPKEEKVEIGACPLCGKSAVAAENSFYCSTGSDNCKWSFPRIIKGTRLANEDMASMLKGQKTRPLTFAWKNGKQGEAALFLDEDGKLGWDFNP